MGVDNCVRSALERSRNPFNKMRKHSTWRVTYVFQVMMHKTSQWLRRQGNFTTPFKGADVVEDISNMKPQ